MKTIFLVLCSLFSLSVFSQTYDLEIQNMAKKFADGEFSLVDYKQYGDDWADLIKSMNGYPTLPYNVLAKEIEFKSIRSFNNFDKKTIFDRIIEWGSMKFGNVSSALQYSNFENGKIIMKGWFKVY